MADAARKKRERVKRNWNQRVEMTVNAIINKYRLLTKLSRSKDGDPAMFHKTVFEALEEVHNAAEAQWKNPERKQATEGFKLS